VISAGDIGAYEERIRVLGNGKSLRMVVEMNFRATKEMANVGIGYGMA
jgi:hypothetical protein